MSANTGEACTCAPAFRAVVYSRHDQRKIQRTFPTLSAAKVWRQDALVDVRRGDLRASDKTTLHDASRVWLEQAQTGAIRNRSGEIYKPSKLGRIRLSELERGDVQALVDRLGGSSLAASTIRNPLLPLRAICRRAHARGEIRDNPTRGLELPAVRMSVGTPTRA